MDCGVHVTAPKIEIHLKCLNRHVDLVGEAYDLAIRESLEPHDNATLSRRYLGSHSQCLVASPTLFERGKIPKNMQELKAYPSLAFGFPLWTEVELRCIYGMNGCSWTRRIKRGAFSTPHVW
ncbi:hypothetical protein HED51_20760 [Ochrobactrum grignonense]|nr:hypothetical protein [Brucella grignonensis]